MYLQKSTCTGLAANSISILDVTTSLLKKNSLLICKTTKTIQITFHLGSNDEYLHSIQFGCLLGLEINLDANVTQFRIWRLVGFKFDSVVYWESGLIWVSNVTQLQFRRRLSFKFDLDGYCDSSSNWTSTETEIWFGRLLGLCFDLCAYCDSTSIWLSTRTQVHTRPDHKWRWYIWSTAQDSLYYFSRKYLPTPAIFCLYKIRETKNVLLLRYLVSQLSIVFKCIVTSMWVKNYFSPYNPFPQIKMSHVPRNSIAISMLHVLRSYIP